MRNNRKLRCRKSLFIKEQKQLIILNLFWYGTHSLENLPSKHLCMGFREF